MIKMTTLEFTKQWQEILTIFHNKDKKAEITVPVNDLLFFIKSTKVAIEQGLIEDKEIDVYFGSKK